VLGNKSLHIASFHFFTHAANYFRKNKKIYKERERKIVFGKENSFDYVIRLRTNEQTKDRVTLGEWKKKKKCQKGRKKFSL
jgi:hypothetical protein